MAITQYVLFTVLAEGLPADTFCQQLKAARARHATWSITGAVLFDGEALMCLLEGDQQVLAQARQALAQGLPSAAWQVLHHGVAVGQRMFKDWRVGYAEPHALQSLCQRMAQAAHSPAELSAAQRLEAFVQLFNQSDPQ